MEDDSIKQIEENFFVSQDFIETYKHHTIIKDIIRDFFPRLPKKYISDIIESFLMNRPIVFTDYVDKDHFMFTKIKKKIDEKYHLVPFYYAQLRNKIVEKLNELNKGFEFNEKSDDDDTIKDTDYIRENGNTFKINKNATKKELFKIFCDEEGKCDFQYDFNKRDLEFSIPTTTNNLQLCRVQISSLPIVFGLSVEHHYQCPDKYVDGDELCDSPMVITRKAYEVEGVKERIICPGKKHHLDNENRDKTRRCGKQLIPIEKNSIFVNGYYYDISYENAEGGYENSGAFSFKKLMPGYYEVVMFSHIGNLKMSNFQIVDIKTIEDIAFKFPKKVDGKNYILTLQEAIDDFIKKQCGIRIYGLVPIKLSFLLQKLASCLDWGLNFNIDFTGSKSVGKSLLMKYYGICLYNYGFIGTNGLSISVPALRGTTDKILVMGKEVSISRIGYLGTYRNIHIDEVGENPELIQHLKIFLMENNYSNNMARADGISRKRTAHINLTKNLDNEHIGQYRGGIKKMYDNLQPKEGIPLHPWNNNWDLFQPIDSYDDIYLRGCIKKQRDKLHNAQKWWIDGCELPLHDRFPFYFYVEDDNNKNLQDVLMENSCSKNIEEFMMIIKHLKNSDIDNNFKNLKKYDATIEKEVFVEVNTILNDYNLIVDSRINRIYYMIIKLSMILNRRTKPNTEDYDLLRYLIENINRKVTTTEIEKYQIRGPYIMKYHNIIDENANKDFILQTGDEEILEDFK